MADEMALALLAPPNEAFPTELEAPPLRRLMKSAVIIAMMVPG
jgi:hypothetical protein